jgi:hypothetical protein
MLRHLILGHSEIDVEVIIHARALTLTSNATTSKSRQNALAWISAEARGMWQKRVWREASGESASLRLEAG